MADFALPQSLSISDIRRNAMPAVRRTVLHGSTSQNVYGAGELVYIPVDTGTAGAFFVPETSRLDMTVNIYNKNYFVDFVNLPRCGFHCLIEEFGIEIHNSLHENQRFYAEMIEQDMIRHGENQIPYEMTVSNPHEVGGGVAGGMHINLIKPSMVTTAGLPHGVAYRALSQPAGSNISSTVANDITEGLLLNAVTTLKMPTGRTGYGTPPAVFNTPASLVWHPTGGNLKDQLGQNALTNFPIASFYDDRININKSVPVYPVHALCGAPIIGSTATRNIQGFQPAAGADVPVTTTADVNGNRITEDFNLQPSAVGSELIYGGGRISHNIISDYYSGDTGSTYGFHTQALLENRFLGYPASGGAYSKYRAYIREAYGAINSDNSIYQADFGQTVGGYTPLMWPCKQPCDTEKLWVQLKSAKRGINTKNVQNYYANCKNIVCSIPLRLTDNYGADDHWGDKIHDLPDMSDNMRGQMTSFRVSLKLYSCLLGVYAKKWFPSLLIGAGRMRIRMKLQQPNIAFQTLMDPCRVVPHTARDRFPYLGVHSTTTPINTLSDSTLSCLSHAVHPILISNYIPGACYNDLVCMGRFPIPQLNMGTIADPNLAFELSHDRLGNVASDYHNMASNTVSNVYNGLASTDDRTLIHTKVILPFEKVAPANEADVLHYIAANAPVNGSTELQQTLALQRQIEDSFYAMGKLAFEMTKNVRYGYAPTIYDNLAPSQLNANDKGRIDIDSNIREEKFNDQTPLANVSISLVQNYQKATRFDNFFSSYFGGLNDAQAGDNGTYQEFAFPLQEVHGSDLAINPMNWQIHNYPLVQYVPTRSPWDKRGARTLTQDDFVDEAEMCYGTYLERSKAQVRRTNRNLFSLGKNNENYPGISERLTYTVSNITYRVEEIILPESASMQIIASAMEGGITMEADSVKSIEQILPKQDNQKILINVSGGIVNDICFLFQPTEMLQGDKAYGYNSYAFYCPWTSFTFKLEKNDVRDAVNNPNDVIKAPPSTPDVYNYLGGNPQYHNALHMGENIGINTFLSIATEYFPRNPINDLQTLIDHVTWGDQRRGDIEYLGLDPLLQNSYDTSNFQKIFPFQDGFYSVFTPIECLNDQTITDNPFWTPLELNLKKRIRGMRANNPALPFLKPLEGTFHLSFNLQAFMGQHDRMNVGTPMVNNNSYLQMQNCHLLREHECRMLTFIRCFARIVIERGGIVQIFT